MIIGNDSDTKAYLSMSELARLNAGIPLAAGQVLIDEPDVFGRIYQGPWSVITTAANKNICFIEVR